MKLTDWFRELSDVHFARLWNAESYDSPLVTPLPHQGREMTGVLWHRVCQALWHTTREHFLTIQPSSSSQSLPTLHTWKISGKNIVSLEKLIYFLWFYYYVLRCTVYNTDSKFRGWAGSFSGADSRARRWNMLRPHSRPRIQTAGNFTLTSRVTEGVEEKPRDGVVREGSQRSCLNQSWVVNRGSQANIRAQCVPGEEISCPRNHRWGQRATGDEEPLWRKQWRAD